MPDFVSAAIRHHHELPDEESGAAITLVAILQLAIHFYHRINNHTDVIWDKIGPRVLEEIGLVPDDIEDYFEDISNRFHEAVE